MQDVNYNNITFLSRPEIGRACLLLGEMVGDLISLVPLVWNKIESLKKKLFAIMNLVASHIEKEILFGNITMKNRRRVSSI
jgi:hypothetical protein